MSSNLKYFLTVGALFKNEAHILKEWIEHYLYHGFEHIYLLNDKSTDNYMEIVKPYIEKGILTLYDIDEPYELGRQSKLYDEYFMPKLINKEIKWLLICDLDEFLWSTRQKDIKNILKYSDYLSQIQFDVNLFGSNGHEKQPKYVVPNFTKRASYPTDKNYRNFKYLVNSSYRFKTLGVHSATYYDEDIEDSKKTFIRSDYSADKDLPWFVLNHYIIQSKDFWKKIKLTRGDADHYRTGENERNLDEFYKHDYKDEEDLRLFEQNKELYEKLMIEDHSKIDDYIDL